MVIFKSDNKSTRNAKRSFKNKLKQRKRLSIRDKKNLKTARENFNHNNIYIKYFYMKNRIAYWNEKIQNAIIVNENLSLFDNPNEVLTVLLKILYNSQKFRIFPTLKFKGRVSFGTLYLIDNLCFEISKNRRWGIRCQNMDVDDNIIFSRLRSFDSEVSQNEKSYMINENVRINRSNKATANQQYRVKSKEITDMVIQGVRENGNKDFELSEIAYQAISSTIGEHFDNIIEHVPDAENGFLCGFYDKELKEISILIFNFGITIYESLNNNFLPIEIQRIKKLIVDNHSSKNYFGLKSKFTEENAITLLALQEGISSKLEYDPTRGFGIMDYIEHCFKLNTDSKISIISGRTSIKIDKKYEVKETFFIDRVRRIIAFNSKNNILEKPDEEYVRNIASYFPGVIIETKIPLGINTYEQTKRI